MNMFYLLVLLSVAFCGKADSKRQVYERKDPCHDYYCANGGVCVLNNGYKRNPKCSKPTCQCTGSWKGDRCDDNPCTHVSCNTGMCFADETGLAQCFCLQGTSGQFCEIEDPCHNHYCANGGVCVPSNNSEPTCQCSGAWTGDRCDDSPCENVNCNTGICSAAADGSAYCCCPEGTSGQFCEIEEPCHNYYCANGGVCVVANVDGHPEPSCQCVDPWKGNRCDETCPQLESPLNGQISLEGSSAIFSCDQNFVLCGPDNVTCGGDVQWDRETPICIKPYAKPPAIFKYGDSVYYFSDETKNFFDAQVNCEDLGGYLFTRNSWDEWEFIKCLLSQENSGDVAGLWLGYKNENGEWVPTSGESDALTISHQPGNTLFCISFPNVGDYMYAHGMEFCNDRDYHFICEKK